FLIQAAAMEGGRQADLVHLGDEFRIVGGDCSLGKGCTRPKEGRPQASDAPGVHGPSAGRRYWFIDWKKSELVLACFSLSTRNSIASTTPMGIRMRRSTHILLRVALSTSSSSLRVPDLVMSMAGKVRLSESLRSRMISELPVPLNSSKMTSSMRLPVSIRAVAMMVSEPPSSM